MEQPPRLTALRRRQQAERLQAAEMFEQGAIAGLALMAYLIVR
jgi:hypothetical protein